jgi:hypothetical protein
MSPHKKKVIETRERERERERERKKREYKEIHN